MNTTNWNFTIDYIYSGHRRNYLESDYMGIRAADKFIACLNRGAIRGGACFWRYRDASLRALIDNGPIYLYFPAPWFYRRRNHHGVKLFAL